MPEKKDNTAQSIPGLEPVGPPIGWRRWKILCGRCGEDAGFVLASDLFRDKGKPHEPRQNTVSGPRYAARGRGQNICPLCVGCLAELAGAQLWDS